MWNSNKIGQCPVCGRWKSVYNSGKMRAHGWQRRCRGNYQYALRTEKSPPVDSW